MVFNLFKKKDDQQDKEKNKDTLKQEQQATAVCEETCIEENNNINSESDDAFAISVGSLKEKVSKTSEGIVSSIVSFATGAETVDDDMLDDIEDKLIVADIGMDTTVEVIEKIRDKKNSIRPDQLKDIFKQEFAQILKEAGSNKINLKENQLNIILITGVNGVGKTTLIGKLAHRYKSQDKKIIIAAADTFRAAAQEQLEIWAERAGVDIIGKYDSDPAAVVFDAIQKAKDESKDILIIDTAGRLHNKFNLMEELKKIKKIIDREAPEALAESILVIDANTGQNGLKQAQVFKEAVDLTSVAVTKLDGSAKGGIVIGISKELNLPVKLIGVGEKINDLKDFNAEDFVTAVFD